MKRISRQLIDKSQEALILALEIYNKPTIKYRIEGFCFFYTNAWELLLKTKIIENTKNENSIYYKKNKGIIRKSLSLRDCLKKVFPNENDPIRKNIESVSDIRDCATHFIIEELENIYSGLFQAGVLNYVDKLNEWFNCCITDKCSPALITLVGDIKDINPIKIKKKYGHAILEFVETQIKELRDREKTIGNEKYQIPIEYRLVLTKVEKESNIKITASSDEGKSAILVEIPKDLNKTHPYLAKHIISKVKETIKDRFTMYDFQAILAVEKIKGNIKYHYMITSPQTHKYSDKLIFFIIDNINNNSNYLQNTRQKYQQIKPRKKE